VEPTNHVEYEISEDVSGIAKRCQAIFEQPNASIEVTVVPGHARKHMKGPSNSDRYPHKLVFGWPQRGGVGDRLLRYFDGDPQRVTASGGP
jgi:hypothetical protein